MDLLANPPVTVSPVTRKRLPAVFVTSVLLASMLSGGLSEPLADSQQHGATGMRRVLTDGGRGLEQLLVDKIAVEAFDFAIQDDQNDDVPTLLASGSSYAKPLHTDAFSVYAKQVYPSIFHKKLHMEYHGVGSSKGLCRLQGHEEHCDEDDMAHPTEGKFMFGASDYPYTAETQEEFPNHMVLPVASSAVVVAYNIPGLPPGTRPFAVDMPTLARIFTGKIRHWRDPEMMRLNPDIAQHLPDANITLVVREGGSGTNVVFKRALVPYDDYFQEQADAQRLESGGPSGWPDANGTFVYRDTTSGVAYAVMETPYSIAYVGQNAAVESGLDTFSIQEDCMELRVDSLADTVGFIERMPLPPGLDGSGYQTDKATARQLKPTSNHRSEGIYRWPFMGYTYLTIKNETPSGGVTCEEMALAAQYMIWYYEADIVKEIAALHMFALLAKKIRHTLAEKLKTTMTCNGKPLLEVENLGNYDRDLEVVATTTDAGHMLDVYYLGFQTMEHYFAPTVTTKYNISPDSPFGEKEDFRVMPMSSRATQNPDHVWLPWIMTGVVIQANLPGIHLLEMSLKTLSLILSGSIRSWNDPALVESNSALQNVDQPLSVMVHPEVAGILADALQDFGGSANATANGLSGPAVVARMIERQYTLALLPGFKVVPGFGVIAGVKNSDDAAAVMPSGESLMKCLGDEEVAMGMAWGVEREGCYPLVFPVVSIVNKQYAAGRDAAGRQTVLFWYWMLGKDSVESNQFVVHIYTAAGRALQRFIEQQFLSVSLSNGEPVIEVIAISKPLMYLIIGIAVVVPLLLAVVLALSLLYSKSMKILSQVKALKSEMELDTESPVVKVMKFLQGVTQGEKMDIDRARNLLTLLQNTDNLQAPDIKTQLRTLRVERDPRMSISSERGVRDNEFGNYIMNLTDAGEQWSSRRKNSSSSNLAAQETSDAFGHCSDLVHKEANPELIRCLNVILESTAATGLPTDRLVLNAEELSHIMEPLATCYFCNVTHLEPLTGHRPLSAVTMFLIHSSSLVSKLSLNRDKLLKFLLVIEANYPSNNYHNRLHAAFVVQRTYVTFKRLPMGESKETDTWLLAALIGAAVHDVLHPGFNNGYLVQGEATVARTFNDQAVLENQSLFLCLELMRSDETNFIQGSELEPRSAWQQFKSLLVKTVLATDMSNHFEIVAKFQQKFSSLTNWGGAAGTDQTKIIVDNAALLIQMTVKAADIGHCYARIEQHLYWSKCLEDEFFQQGDVERDAQLPISPLMDRNKQGVMAAKNQIGFFSVVCLPMLEAFADSFEAGKPLLQQAKANVQWWKLRTSENYKIMDIETYRNAMNVTVEQQPEPSLIDFVTDLDKESKVKLPECGTDEEEENDANRSGKTNWAKAKRLSSMKTDSRGSLVRRVARVISRDHLGKPREAFLNSWERLAVLRENTVHPTDGSSDSMEAIPA